MHVKGIQTRDRISEFAINIENIVVLSNINTHTNACTRAANSAESNSVSRTVINVV